MKLAEYPQFTIIMRGYDIEEATAILKAMKGYEKQFAIEVTMNTESAVAIIEHLNQQSSAQAFVGAGTVMNIDEERAAIDAGAQFLLGPQRFTQEMIDYAEGKGVLTIPAAFTPSEITELFREGADIVKVFPAMTVGPAFFSAVQAPLGKLRLMAVGGISIRNAEDFIEAGSDYLGIGSGMFEKQDITSKNIAGLQKSIKKFAELGILQKES